MTNDNRFDAALRAHVFHRPFPEGEEGGARPGAPPPDQATPAPRSPDFASELEAALMRDLNTLTAGLRPKKLLPARASLPAPAVPVAAAAKRSRRAALLRRPGCRRRPGPRPPKRRRRSVLMHRRRNFPQRLGPPQPTAFRPVRQRRAARRRQVPTHPSPGGRHPHRHRRPWRRRPGPPKPAAPAPSQPAPAPPSPKPESRYAPPKRPAYPGQLCEDCQRRRAAAAGGTGTADRDLCRTRQQASDGA